MLPLRIGLIKSRFHYFRGPKLNISWFLNVLTCFWLPKPVLFSFGEAWTPPNLLQSIWEHPGKIFSFQIWVSKSSKSESQIWVSNLGPHCFEFIFWIYILNIYFGHIFWIYILNIYFEYIYFGYIFLIYILDIYFG